MLTRFCLYGFLRNQQYFEPFFYLALLTRGIDFFTIGILFGAKALMVNLLEIPTGAIADSVGRRKSLIFSHIAYLIAITLFSGGKNLPLLLLGMAFYAIGESFRSGTHKAVIFSWLKLHGLQNQKTEIYGKTRSWSKAGAAISALIAGAIVFITQSYTWLFWFSLIPLTANIFNFLAYPKDSPATNGKSFQQRREAVWQSLKTGLSTCWNRRPLKGLLVEGMLFEGSYKTVKDYIQPMIRDFATGLVLLSSFSAERQIAILIAISYGLIFALSSLASRYAGRFSTAVGGEARGARLLWKLDLGAYLFILSGVISGQLLIGIIGFLLVTVLQNLWRPVLVSRVSEHSDNKLLATVLSTESQSRTLFMALAAPFIGYTVDQFSGTGLELLPIAIFGLTISIVGIFYSAK
ncbi:MAG: MFS transporter [Verrucomicrobiota bacterium]